MKVMFNCTKFFAIEMIVLIKFLFSTNSCFSLKKIYGENLEKKNAEHILCIYGITSN